MIDDTTLSTTAVSGSPIALAVAADATAAPEWVMLMRRGPLRARDGRKWSNPDPAEVVATTRSRAAGTPLPFDYEHQTQKSSANGQPAPASGWIPELELREGDIWGRVEWTAKAARHILDREYRFYSPTFYHDAAGRVLALAGAALTNTPALDVPALAKENDMNDRFLPLLHIHLLTADSTEADVRQACARQQALESADSRAEAVATGLGLARDASATAILAAAKATNVDPGQFVPRTEFDTVAQTLAALQKSATESRATTAVDAAVAAGKITPALRDWALSYATSDPEAFDKYAAAAPRIVTAAGPGPEIAGDPNAALSPVELSVCANMGIDPAKYTAVKQAERRNV